MDEGKVLYSFVPRKFYIDTRLVIEFDIILDITLLYNIYENNWSLIFYNTTENVMCFFRKKDGILNFVFRSVCFYFLTKRLLILIL